MTTEPLLCQCGLVAAAAAAVLFVTGVFEHAVGAPARRRAARRTIAAAMVAAAAAAAAVGLGCAMGVDNPSGVDGRHVPQNPRQSTRAQDAIAAEFGRQAARVNAEVAAAYKRLAATGEASAAFRAARAAELSVKIDRVRADLAGGVRPAVTETVSRARRAGLRVGRRNIRAIGLEDAARAAGQSASFAGVNERAVRLGALDTLGRLGAAFDAHAAGAVRVFRDLSASAVSARTPAVNRAVVDGLVSGSTRVTEGAVRDLFRGDAEAALSYRRLGNKQITVGRSETNVRAYARMLMRTRTRELTVAAQRDAQLDVGLDLAQIVGVSSANFCTRYLGLVVVLGPARGGYPSVDELPGGLPPYHPNCTKEIVAYSEVSASDTIKRTVSRAQTAFRVAQRQGLLTTNLKET